jgi:hypothetical protein
VVDAPERAEEEEEGGVGGSIVYCDGCARDVDACVELGACKERAGYWGLWYKERLASRTACCYVYIVVPRAVVADIS